jgi:hypothetical protein
MEAEIPGYAYGGPEVRRRKDSSCGCQPRGSAECPCPSSELLVQREPDHVCLKAEALPRIALRVLCVLGVKDRSRAALPQPRDGGLYETTLRILAP